MKHEQMILLKGDEPIDIELLIALNEWLKQRGVSTHLVDQQSFVIQEAQKLLQVEGASHILPVVELREELLPKVSLDERPLLIRLLNAQLSKLSPQTNFLIIDPYFFSEWKDVEGYLTTVHSILDSIVRRIDKLTIVTNCAYDEGLYTRMKSELTAVNPRLVVTHHTTDDFHDRFWIADEGRGIFIGTSLNGLGKRYALTDYMQEADVRGIVEYLRKRRFL